MAYKVSRQLLNTICVLWVERSGIKSSILTLGYCLVASQHPPNRYRAIRWLDVSATLNCLGVCVCAHVHACMRAHGAFWWPGIPLRVYSCLTPRVPSSGTGSTGTLSRKKNLLKMTTEWMTLEEVRIKRAVTDYCNSSPGHENSV